MFLRKNTERLCYIYMLLILNTGHLVASFFTLFPFLVLKTGKKKDLLLLPYYPKNSLGDVLRFSVYKKMLEADNITFDIAFADEESADIDYYHSGPAGKRYLKYSEIYRRRLRQVLRAGNYNAVFVQRGLFPFYPDQRVARLEKLLNKLCRNTTVDFYDADYVANETLVHSCAKNFRKVSVVNNHLKEHFDRFHKQVEILPLSLNAEPYLLKTNYELNGDVRLFWTGCSINIQYLKKLSSALSRIAKEFPVRLVLVTPRDHTFDSVETECHRYDKTTFYGLLNSADIALYPADCSEINLGKTATKVLEYMATGLPVIGAPFGIPSSLEDRRDIIIARSEPEWEAFLRELITNAGLRENLGINARKAFDRFHDPHSSYKRLKNIIFAN